jgi:Glycosyltransferase family 87
VRSTRWIFLSCAALLVIAYALTKPLPDFVEYWVGAHQLIAGRSPYSFAESLQLERALRWSKSLPIVALNPPWALPLVAPLGVLRWYAVGWLAWLGIMAFAVWWSMKLLLGLYTNGRRLFPSETASSERILAFTFYPTLLCLGTAQITPLVLLGLAGFLHFVTRKRYGLAGASLALASIKPHLVYLIWCALILWCWREGKWKPLVSLTLTVCGLLGAAILMRPTILRDYLQFQQSGYVKIWPSALGTILRYPFNSVESFPLQFVAPILGAIWFVLYWIRRRRAWDWKQEAPSLVTVSVLTAAYGWTLDEVVLLVPIVAIAARYLQAEGGIPRRIAWIYTAVNVLVILGSLKGPALPYILPPLAITIVLAKTAVQPDGSLTANSVHVTG